VTAIKKYKIISLISDMSLSVSSPPSRKRKAFDADTDTPHRRIHWQLRKDFVDSEVRKEDSISVPLKDVLNGLEKNQLQAIILRLVERDESLHTQVEQMLPRPVLYF
jgi:hypothetical protein